MVLKKIERRWRQKKKELKSPQKYDNDREFGGLAITHDLTIIRNQTKKKIKQKANRKNVNKLLKKLGETKGKNTKRDQPKIKC